MRIFNKFVFICNMLFIVAGILRIVENYQKKAGNFNGGLIPLGPLEYMVVVLGYGAIVVNLILLLICIYRILFGYKLLNPVGITIINLIMFPIQVWYFFFSKF